MKDTNQKVKTYNLNEDFKVECEIGDVMTVRVVQVSLPWVPTVEEYTGITDKNEANKLFKEMVSKYRLCLRDSVLIRR